MGTNNITETNHEHNKNNHKHNHHTTTQPQQKHEINTQRTNTTIQQIRKQQTQ